MKDHKTKFQLEYCCVSECDRTDHAGMVRAAKIIFCKVVFKLMNVFYFYKSLGHIYIEF